MIDAHCHLADPRFDATRDERIARERSLGVTRFIQGGVGPEDWDRQLELAARYTKIVEPVFGLHPWWVAGHTAPECDAALALLPSYLDRGSIGLGELGLDFHERHARPESHPLQEKVFEFQLRMACERNLPVILHVVKAHARAIEILKATGIPEAGGIVHRFSGGKAEAEAYLRLGLTLSIGGSVARKGFERTKRAVVSIPIENWVLETDDEPISLLEVARAFGALKGIDPAAALEQSRRTLVRIFSLK